VLSYIVYDKGDSRHSIVLFLAGKHLSLDMPENTCRPVLADPDEAAGAPTHVRHTQDRLHRSSSEQPLGTDPQENVAQPAPVKLR
jgi:hypothetical protein